MNNIFKHIIYCACLILGVFSLWHCQRSQQSSPPKPQEAELQSPYPPALQEVFEAHGGLEKWRTFRSLYFEIEKEEGLEKHHVHLHDRRDRVEGEDFLMGYDGSRVWLQADSSYQGNPIFYHNLMFYFYAMPFVLADEGIRYSAAEPLVFEGNAYPGFRIAYDEGIGSSSKDEYFIHFDPQTKQMAWLGYTVTYFSQQPSSDIHWIRYDQWQQLNGLMLPKSLAWYTYREGKPVDFRNRVIFSQVQLSEQAPTDRLLVKPEEAVYYQDE